MNGVLTSQRNAVIEGQPRRHPPFVLPEQREIDVAQTAIHVAAALKEHHREAEQKTRERIAGRKRREHEKAVRRDPFRHVDLVPPELARPNLKLCDPAVCATESCTSYVFCAVSRGPVIGLPTLA